ncbi:hypothetical protein LJC74_01575 [Eubacteriales bacterium OttesenSCG-928-A19]|nr:hypothetical protein [Eubacteriales bacterium OttesenSCG-928-A19]
MYQRKGSEPLWTLRILSEDIGVSRSELFDYEKAQLIARMEEDTAHAVPQECIVDD